MQTSRLPSKSFKHFVLVVALIASPAYADQLVYVPLAQPCRLLDTRTSTGGPGPLTAAHGAYLFGTSDTDIESAQQHGSATGCSIPSGATAVSVNMNMLNASAAGNIVTWTADTGSAPNIGTAVYNPSVATPMAGQVLYNTGYTTIPLGSDIAGKFHLQVANGEIDMTINLVGYWLPISWSETRSGNRAVALGNTTKASGDSSTALGNVTIASGFYSTALGNGTNASGDSSAALNNATTASGTNSTAMGNHTTASGAASTAMGSFSTASGTASFATGSGVIASGDTSIAMGSNVNTNQHSGAFIFGDASARTSAVISEDNQFLTVASGGVYFFTNPTRTSGAYLLPNNGSWTNVSDRNAKTAVKPVDPREVLKKVAALPLNTWQYKSQDSKYRHMGPMAQDFYAAFQLGETDKGIDTIDADGVALAAIQGLHALLNEKDARIVALEAEVAAQKQDLGEQRVQVAALSLLASELADVKAEMAALRRSSPSMVTVASKQP